MTAGDARATRCACSGSASTSSTLVPPPEEADDGGGDGRRRADDGGARQALDLPLSAAARDAAPAAGAASAVARRHLSRLAVRAAGAEPVPYRRFQRPRRL